MHPNGLVDQGEVKSTICCLSKSAALQTWIWRCRGEAKTPCRLLYVNTIYCCYEFLSLCTWKQVGKLEGSRPKFQAYLTNMYIKLQLLVLITNLTRQIHVHYHGRETIDPMAHKLISMDNFSR